MMTDPAQDDLPPHLLAVAFRAGRELAWPREEAIEVIDWLARQGRAVEGVEVWLPAGAGPEIPFPLMYVWQVDPARVEEESWADFVVRAKEQASSYVYNFKWDESDLVYQGRRPFFNLDTTENGDP